VESLQWVARAVIALVFVGMGITHFVPSICRGMAAMVPEKLTRGRLITAKNLVWFTGGCEIAGGLGILIPTTMFAAGIALVIFLIAVFPANVFAAEHPETFGRAAIPFWPRYIAQLVLMALILGAVVSYR